MAPNAAMKRFLHPTVWPVGEFSGMLDVGVWELSIICPEFCHISEATYNSCARCSLQNSFVEAFHEKALAPIDPE
jgi:hypothetical protein